MIQTTDTKEPVLDAGSFCIYGEKGGIPAFFASAGAFHLKWIMV